MTDNFGYPVLGQIDAEQVWSARLTFMDESGSLSLSEAQKAKMSTFVTYRGDGVNVAEGAVLNATEKISSLLNGEFLNDFADKPRMLVFEQQASILLHSALRSLPKEVLVDDDFWCYISLIHMFEFVMRRYPKVKDGQPVYQKAPGRNNFGLVKGSREFLRCFPYRMFLAADIAWRHSQETDYGLINRFPGHGDQWQSHVLAQKYSALETLTEAVLSGFSEVRDLGLPKPTAIDRHIASNLKSIRSFQVLEALPPSVLPDLVRRSIGEANARINKSSI